MYIQIMIWHTKVSTVQLVLLQSQAFSSAKVSTILHDSDYSIYFGTYRNSPELRSAKVVLVTISCANCE
jgi:hypothetical protein